jgi:hypothetical protein
LFVSSKRFFSQGDLINTKLRNRLNKNIFENIIYLKSWRVFINKEDEAKKAENEQNLKGKNNLEKVNHFFIVERA